MKHAKHVACLALALVCMDSGARCTARDKWTGADKNLHATAGLFIGAGAMAQTGSALMGAAVGAGVGLAKEVYDLRGYGTCSFQDFAVTAIGAAVGAYGGKWMLTHSSGKTLLVYRSEF